MTEIEQAVHDLMSLSPAERQRCIDILAGALEVERKRREELFTDVKPLCNVEMAEAALAAAAERGVVPSEDGKLTFLMQYGAAIGAMT